MPADLTVMSDLRTPDLATACVNDGDADGGVVPTLWMVAPSAGGMFAARLRGGSWTTLATAAGAVDDVALAAVAGRPLATARLHDATLVAATWDACRAEFSALGSVGIAASTAARPALVGGSAGDVVFRGAVNGDQRYYWAHFDGAAWGAIATQGNFLSALAPTAVRAGGAVHAIFAGTDGNLWDGVVQATGGGTSTQLTGNTSAMAPAAAVAPGGAVHVVYTGTNEHLYWFVAGGAGDGARPVRRAGRRMLHRHRRGARPRLRQRRQRRHRLARHRRQAVRVAARRHAVGRGDGDLGHRHDDARARDRGRRRRQPRRRRLRAQRRHAAPRGS